MQTLGYQGEEDVLSGRRQPKMDSSLQLIQRRWANEFDKDFHFACPKQQTLNSIISTHNDKYEDRLWDFTCKATFSQKGQCYWTNYVNWFDEEFYFTCPFGSVISGMESYHRNYEEDRRWKYLCCTGTQTYTSDCNWTYYVNTFDSYIHWQVPHNYFLVGISSYHDNYTEDRRWKFQYCAKS
ncbi:hemagglutinin/amebocyte aggregation factor-like [Rhinophrynus dorsalis]